MSLDSLSSSGAISKTTYDQLNKLINKRNDQYFVIDKQARLKIIDSPDKQNVVQRIYQFIKEKRSLISSDKDQVATSVLFTLRNLTKALDSAQSKKTQLSQDALKGLMTVVDAANRVAQGIISQSIKQKLLDEAAKIQQSIKQDEFLWVQKTCPSMASDIKNVQHVLEASENKTLPLNQRMQLTPRPPQSAGEGVTFFVSTVRVEVPDPAKNMKVEVESARPDQIKPRMIVKSAARERDMGDTLNFPNGQGPMRERIAYTAQKALGLDCGVPQTAMTKLSHSVFSNDAAINTHLQTINKALSINIDLQTLVNLCEGGPNPEVFRTNMLERTLDKLKETITGEALHKEIDTLVAKLKENPSEPPTLSENLTKANKLSNQAALAYIEMMRQFMLPDKAVDDAIKEAWNLSYAPETTEATLVSCQHLVGGCQALIDMSEDEIAMISPKQFEKCVMDILLINSDRGLQNLLAKSIPTENLLGKMARGLNLSEKLLEESIEGLKLHPTSDLTERMQTLVDELKNNTGKNFELTNREESLLNALLHAKANHYSSAFELILIDNSQSMPRLVDLQNASPLSPLKNAVPIHGWESLPQAALTVLSGKAKEKIQKLDVDAYVDSVRADQKAHLSRYGKDCDIDESCFDLLKINTLLLKESVNQGLSLKEMNLFLKKTLTNPSVSLTQYSPSPFQKLYRKHFIDSATQQLKPADWDAIKKDIQEFVGSVSKH